MQPTSDPLASPPAAGDFGRMRWLLPLSVFVSGAVVMVVEVLCTRLIAPVYGTSLYVWSSIIAVTLLSLSLGYWLGGGLADRAPRPSVYFLVIEIAAVLILIVPFLREPIFAFTKPLGLRGGALASAILFLTAPLTLLGMVSPFAVRLAAHLLSDLGRTTGRLYALSTAGSLIGTLTAGFYLIPAFGVRSIFFGAAAALVVPGLLYRGLHASQRLHAAAVLAVIVAALLLPRPARPANVRLVDESHFGQIKVVEQQGTLMLLLNGAVQTHIDEQTKQSLATYPAALAELAWSARVRPGRALILGLGGGVLPDLFSPLGLKSVSVEIDPAVVEVAVRDFGLDVSRHPVAVEDARRYLADSDETYSLIVLDVFAGEVVPSHLLSTEMVDLLDAHLAERGVILLNYVGYRTGSDARALRSIARTLEQRFPWVYAFGLPPEGDFGNAVLVARREAVQMRAEASPLRVPDSVRSQIQAIEAIDLSGPAILLTDDYNPLDLWSAEAHEKWRRMAMASFDEEIHLAE